MKDLGALIDEVLAVKDLMPSTQEDLEDFKRDLSEGELGKDDREYITALHGRLVGGGGTPAATPTADDDDDDEDDDHEDDEPGDVTDLLETEIEELRQALAERDARIVELESQLLSAQNGTDQR